MSPTGRRRGESNNLAARINNDLFGSNDAVVKYVLEGHDRGVNWASFHPTLPLIVSGADDNQVKLWRMNDTKAWEMDTMRGHGNNVSCVIFHQSNEQDLIVSNSEDRSIRVWDVSKRMPVQTFRREHDRFWIVAAHPTRNVLAAGHDSGMVLFKLRRERPAMAFHKGAIFYVKDRYLRKITVGGGGKGRGEQSRSGSSNADVPIMALSRASSGGASSQRQFYDAFSGSSNSSSSSTQPRRMVYNKMNQSEHNILVHSRADGGTYELFTFSKRGPGGRGRSSSASQGNSFKGAGLAVAFVEWNKFAVLERNQSNIAIRDLKNQVTKKIPTPFPGINGLFPSAVASRVILRSEENVWLYEHTSRNVIAELHAPGARRVSWNRGAAHCAIMSKNTVVLTDRNLAQLCVVQEPVSVKGGAWDDCGVFVYTTLSHVKYLLPSGDGGIIRTLEEAVYVLAVRNGVLHCLDRKSVPRRLRIDSTEYRFKMALEKQRFGDVLRIIRSPNSTLCGSAIIAYLQKKGFAEVALHFVQDNRVKFDLALECGNIEIALEAATALNESDAWRRLGAAALRQGVHQVVEMAYQHTKNFEKLSFLYLITGNIDKLRKMRQIADRRRDVMSQCHNSLYLGDVKGNVDLFASVGQKTLAYVAAATHGLQEDASKYKEELEADGLKVPKLLSGAKLLLPPQPIMREDNWPLLTVAKSVFDPTKLDAAIGDDADVDERASKNGDDEDAGEWDLSGDDDGLDGFGDDVSNGRRKASSGGSALDLDDDDGMGGAWGDGIDDDDLSGLDDDDEGSASDSAEAADSKHAGAGTFVAPAAERTHAHYWSQTSTLAFDHVASGEFENAMDLLNRQIGVVNFELLKSKMLDCYYAVRPSMPGLQSCGSIENVYLLRDAVDESVRSVRETAPRPLFTLSYLVGNLKGAYRMFQKGKFVEAQEVFRDIVHSAPLVVVDDPSEADELKELVGFCKEYLLYLKIFARRKELKDDPKLSTELAAYGTHCMLQPPHLVLALMVAMTQSFKLKNYITAATFARRLLETSESGSSAKSVAAAQKKAQKVLKLSERKGMNSVKLSYDDRSSFVLCAKSLEPIYRGSKKITCPYCFATYKPEYVDQTCDVCGLSKIGLETIGLVSYSAIGGTGGSAGGRRR